MKHAKINKFFYHILVNKHEMPAETFFLLTKVACYVIITRINLKQGSVENVF